MCNFRAVGYEAHILNDCLTGFQNFPEMSIMRIVNNLGRFWFGFVFCK